MIPKIDEGKKMWVETLVRCSLVYYLSMFHSSWLEVRQFSGKLLKIFLNCQVSKNSPLGIAFGFSEFGAEGFKFVLFFICSFNFQIRMAATVACYSLCGTAVATCYGLKGYTHGTMPASVVWAIPWTAACTGTFATCESACMATAGADSASTAVTAGAAAASTLSTATLVAVPVAVAAAGATGYLGYQYLKKRGHERDRV